MDVVLASRSVIWSFCQPIVTSLTAPSLPSSLYYMGVLQDPCKEAVRWGPVDCSPEGLVCGICFGSMWAVQSLKIFANSSGWKCADFVSRSSRALISCSDGQGAKHHAPGTQIFIRFPVPAMVTGVGRV